MSPLPRLLAATVLLAASAAASAARAQEAVDIPTRPGKTVRALLLKPAGKPVGSVILLHGGNGHLDLSKAKSARARATSWSAPVLSTQRRAG